MLEIRGDFKDVHKGVLKKVDFLGCERKITFFLLGFLFLGNLFLMWSWYQFLLIGIAGIAFIISRFLYLKDPEMLSVFIDNLHFESEKTKYLLPSSNIANMSKKYRKG